MEEEVHKYSTEEMTVEWRPRLCQHSGRCVAGLPAVFNPEKHPWIQIGDTDADAMDDAIQRCPSGALRFVRHE
jgi:uncharacterized Fe-S cluster protein YjdI